MMGNKRNDRMNIGGASIILIMLVTALSIFALLAIRSSMNERRLANKAAESIKEYYMLDGKAEEIYAKVDGIIREENPDYGKLSEIPEISDVEYGVEGTPTAVKYSVQNGDKMLYVTLEVNEAETKVRKWNTKTDSSGMEYELQITD